MKSGFDRIGRTVTVEAAKRQCLDKQRYDSRNAARDRAAHIAKKFKDSKPQRPYRCTLCGDWHLTTQVPYGLQRGKAPAEAGRQRRRA
jgi:hypothetical protein